MKKKLFVLLAVIMVLSMVSIPALAGPPENAEGVWYYMPDPLVLEKVVGDNTFLSASEVGNWTGTFHTDGVDCMDNIPAENCAVSEEYGSVVIHSNGHWWFKATVIFNLVTVDDKTGGLEMLVTGSRPDASAEWDGKWVITGGTDDLKDLRGQGIWWGPGYNPESPAVPGEIPYSGNIHFKPD